MKKVYLIALFLVMSSTAVSSFGISSPYWLGNPLVLKPGESETVQLELQNMVGGDDMILRAYFREGSEIAEITDPSLEYNLPFGTNGVKVNLLIKAPKNAAIGDTYRIDIAFRSVVPPGGGGPVQLAAEITKKFDVLVRNEPKGESKPETAAQISFSRPTYLIALLAILIIAWIMFFRKHKNNKSPK